MTHSECNIGFISTRFKGNDGVSLETEKWLEILNRMDYSCYFFGGDCDEKVIESSYIIPEAHSLHPDIQSIYQNSFNATNRSVETTDKIHQVKKHLKRHLSIFVKNYHINLLIVENALAIPLNLPFGLAITEFIAETGFQTIAHHHDFFWERKHFLVNCAGRSNRASSRR